MVIKIQSFKRENGSILHSATIPKEIIEETGFSKGTMLEASVDKENRIILTEVK